MFKLSPQSLILALVTTAPFLSNAFEEIDVSASVTAEQSTPVKIVNDLSSGPDSFDAQFSSFRLYLSLAPPGWDLIPACYLVNSSSINTTSMDVQIPASIGPSSSQSPNSIYALATVEFNVDPSNQSGDGGDSSDGGDSNNDVGALGFEYSNSFKFQDGVGNWSQYELDGFTIALIDDVPCSAYDCARQCAQKYYPQNVQGDDVSSYQTTYECIAACPGVTYPPFDTIDGGGGDGGGDGDGSGDGSGDGISATAAITSTSLAAADGFTDVNHPSTTGASASASASMTGTGMNSGSASMLTGTASSTASAITPSASKSAANLATSSQFGALMVGFVVLSILLVL